ncbi:alpha/beta fold hydrolase [Streptomyces sp. WMMC1477]|uniref:alpha/beta fold hydrolase n=1 Tax=Streptomyces sp. WMMC1477 TaxID=3015155 RepID=UPI0022B6A8DF|nr:alpha/beta fold hydrolase [Streptomyces sp. WMMC1477]MCZ7434731.1 alpha/beta fold hydrolase [Streptomyces sp. WMMC1477]
MPTIRASGTTISYLDTGAPAGRPDAQTILFGHGLLFSGWVFHPQIAALRRHYRCVAIDWRGQGDSPATPSGYDMDTLTGDAVALIRALGVAPVHWVGLSMGGFVGQRLAARHGELVRSLALLDTSAGPERRDLAAKSRMLALAQLLIGIRPLLGTLRPLLFGPAFLADPAAEATLDEWAARLQRSGRTALRKATLGVADRAPVDTEITEITAPTLVVVGADDATTPLTEAQRIAGLVDGARLEVVADCGHTSPLEQPEAITDLLAEFLGTSAGHAVPPSAETPLKGETNSGHTP